MYTKFRKHVHGRVLVQLVIFFLVSAGLLVAVSYDAITGEIGLGLVALGLVIGLAVGFVVGKIFKLRWHQDTAKVVMSIDKMGFVLIAVYIAFRVFGEQLLGEYVHGAALSALTFAFLLGILVGRFVGVWNGVSRILTEQGIK